MNLKEQVLIYFYYKAKNYRGNFLQQESPGCCPSGSSLQVRQPTSTSITLKKEGTQQTTWAWQSRYPSELPRQQQNYEKHNSFTWPRVNTTYRIKKQEYFNRRKTSKTWQREPHQHCNS